MNYSRHPALNALFEKFTSSELSREEFYSGLKKHDVPHDHPDLRKGLFRYCLQRPELIDSPDHFVQHALDGYRKYLKRPSL